MVLEYGHDQSKPLTGTLGQVGNLWVHGTTLKTANSGHAIHLMEIEAVVGRIKVKLRGLTMDNMVYYIERFNKNRN